MLLWTVSVEVVVNECPSPEGDLLILLTIYVFLSLTRIDTFKSEPY
jgi:hypothetical protein